MGFQHIQNKSGKQKIVRSPKKNQRTNAREQDTQFVTRFHYSSPPLAFSSSLSFLSLFHWALITFISCRSISQMQFGPEILSQILCPIISSLKFQTILVASCISCKFYFHLLFYFSLFIIILWQCCSQVAERISLHQLSESICQARTHLACIAKEWTLIIAMSASVGFCHSGVLRRDKKQIAFCNRSMSNRRIHSVLGLVLGT